MCKISTFLMLVLNARFCNLSRIRNHQHPWPDPITRWTHNRLVCLRRCWRGHSADQLATLEPAGAGAGAGACIDVRASTEEPEGGGAGEAEGEQLQDLDLQDLDLCDLEQGGHGTSEDEGAEQQSPGRARVASDPVHSAACDNHEGSAVVDLEAGEGGGDLCKGKRDSGGCQMPRQHQHKPVSEAKLARRPSTP